MASDTNFKFAADVVLFSYAPHADEQPGELHVLLIQRRWAPFQNQWALPGGHVEPDELAVTAAARELAEETGIHVPRARLRLVGWYDDPDRDPRGRVISAAYMVRVDGLPIPMAADDAAAARWVPYTELVNHLSHRLAFDHDLIIGNALAEARDLGWCV